MLNTFLIALIVLIIWIAVGGFYLKTRISIFGAGLNVFEKILIAPIILILLLIERK